MKGLNKGFLLAFLLVAGLGFAVTSLAVAVDVPGLGMVLVADGVRPPGLPPVG